MKSYLLVPGVAGAALAAQGIDPNGPVSGDKPQGPVVGWFVIAMIVIQILQALGIVKPRTPK